MINPAAILHQVRLRRLIMINVSKGVERKHCILPNVLELMLKQKKRHLVFLHLDQKAFRPDRSSMRSNCCLSLWSKIV